MDSNLNIDIKDYNGPLDVLLELVHKNKFDLSYLSILFNVIINFFKILVKKIFFLKVGKISGLLKKNTNKNFKTIFFPHDILTSGLYKKNF